MRGTWWLDASAIPDLLWACLTVRDDGTASVTDLDGHVHSFVSENEARLWLLEDEYESLESIVEQGEINASVTPPSVWPPARS